MIVADSGAGVADLAGSGTRVAGQAEFGASEVVRPRRFLIVVPPLVGHINPTVGVAAALVARGHQVAWVGNPELVGSLAGPGAEVLDCAVPGAPVVRAAGLRGPAALKFLWETFLIPLAEAMVPGVAAAVEAFAPDVMLVDQQAVAGAVVAMRCGVPWATSATTAAELGNPLAAMPKVDAWVRQLLLELEVRNGLATTAASPRYQCTYGDLRFSPHLVLAYSTAALSGEVAALRETLRYVGPSIAERPTDPAFPWHRLPDDRPLVFASVGTANSDASASFLQACAEAIADRPHLFGVVADPTAAVAPADNVLAVPHVPQLDLLQRADAAICHAGQNTVCEALYHGVPLVVAPIRDDQPVVAQQVTAAGAGVRIRFAHARPTQIGTALDQVLTEPAFAAAARRVGESFRGAGGAAAAAEHLESLAYLESLA
ncbi:glycosyltransferase [Catenulispora sp. NL8]|uniref:Glycosyltransferase n=1 Tax=Catenulispora pinistramenti TaxID=2705254 RepID=A0ABS5L291_9ACTN|nr:glycosyltransferase [Catenulispora pinistramenti]